MGALKDKMPEFSDEILMRFADGELDDATTKKIASALEEDKALARRVELFATTRFAARDAMAPLLEEPVPESLRRSVENLVEHHKAQGRDDRSNVVAISAHRDRRSSRWLELAAAACLAAMAGGYAGYLLTERSEPVVADFGLGRIADLGLARALSTQATGQETDLGRRRFRAIASFRDDSGALCREFEIDSATAIVSVACRQGESWETRFAVAAPLAEAGYAPASSAEALEAYIAAVGGSSALTAAEETAALEGLSEK